MVFILFLGNIYPFRYSFRLDSPFVYGFDLQRSGLYIADHRSADGQPHSCLPDHEPGIGIRRVSGVGVAEPAFVPQRDHRVCIGVCGSGAGTASGQKRSGSK